MDPSGQSSRALPRTLWALLLLLMLGAALAVYIGSRDLRTEARHNSPSERPETATAVPRVKAGQGPPPPADPLPPAGPPASGAEVRPAPEIPPLTPFRRLVLEADTVLELLDLDEPGYTGQSAAVLHAILSGIRSEFSKYSEQRLSGRLPPQEHQNLRVAAHDAFRNPDVDTRAYRIDRAPRVQLWLREGATLPAAEVRTPPGEIPLRRRAQEEVTVETVARWLEAIEAEFGTTDLGAGTRRLPLDIVVFDSQQAYLQFAQDRLSLKPPKWSAGFFSAGWDVICAPTLESTSFAEVLRHEMFHAVQAHLAHGSLGVPWFAEGTAEWLDKAPPKAGVPATHSGFAAAARGHLRYLLEQGLAFELAKFLALDLPAFYGEPELNYLIAYCFVDFLRAKEDLRKVYFEFWALMKDGMAPPDAFYRSFGVLDMADVQRRFLAWLREAPVQQTPVRFTHDAPVDFKDLPLPPALGGTPAAGKSGEIGAGWFQAIGKLKDAGFASAGAPGFIKGDYDLLIVACDNSESMGRPLDESTFDFEAFRRWLFSVRFAGTIKLTRAGAGGEIQPHVATLPVWNRRAVETPAVGSEYPYFGYPRDAGSVVLAPFIGGAQGAKVYWPFTEDFDLRANNGGDAPADWTAGPARDFWHAGADPFADPSAPQHPFGWPSDPWTFVGRFMNPLQVTGGIQFQCPGLDTPPAPGNVLQEMTLAFWITAGLDKGPTSVFVKDIARLNTEIQITACRVDTEARQGIQFTVSTKWGNGSNVMVPPGPGSRAVTQWFLPDSRPDGDGVDNDGDGLTDEPWETRIPWIRHVVLAVEREGLETLFRLFVDGSDRVDPNDPATEMVHRHPDDMCVTDVEDLYASGIKDLRLYGTLLRDPEPRRLYEQGFFVRRGLFRSPLYVVDRMARFDRAQWTGVVPPQFFQAADASDPVHSAPLLDANGQPAPPVTPALTVVVRGYATAPDDPGHPREVFRRELEPGSVNDLSDLPPFRSFRYFVQFDCREVAGVLNDTPVFESVWFTFCRGGKPLVWTRWEAK
ncbi:hypothetical protein EDM80_05210 [bacterium]|nr:MAG: hypothetical protein EDM80_05210 [bacterium]